MTVFRLAFQYQCDATKKVHNCSKVSQEKINFLVFKKIWISCRGFTCVNWGLAIFTRTCKAADRPRLSTGCGSLTTTTCKTTSLMQSWWSHLAHIPHSGSRPTLPIFFQPLWILSVAFQSSINKQQQCRINAPGEQVGVFILKREAFIMKIVLNVKILIKKKNV